MRAQVVKLKHAVTHILHEVPVCVCVCVPVCEHVHLQLFKNNNKSKKATTRFSQSD